MDIEKHNIIEIRPAYKKVRLHKLAKRLNVNSEALLALLKQAGYVVSGDKSNFFLDDNHLDIISKAYSNSVKDLFSKTGKVINTISQSKKSSLFNFFKIFISDSAKYNEDNIYSGELDIDLIDKFFFSIVATVNYFTRGNITRSYIHVKIKIIKSFIEIHKKTISTFIRYHYYNFSIDEDSERSKKICFS